MKIIRLTDDRYVIAAGAGLTMERYTQIQSFWNHWWSDPTNVGLPKAALIADDVTYEDVRGNDIEEMYERLGEKREHL